MTRTRTVALIIVALIAAAYLAGYWPQRSRRVVLETEVAALRTRADEAEARVRVGRLLGALLHLTETVSALNYGQGRELASRFFDDVGSEAAATPVAEFRAALERVLQQRDAVVAALARADPAALDPLRVAQMELRSALGYPTPKSTAP